MPNEVPRVDECWVWVGIDPETNDASVLGYKTPGGYMPLIALTPEDAQDNAILARKFHSDKMDSPDFYHFHFTNCTEMEKLA